MDSACANGTATALVIRIPSGHVRLGDVRIYGGRFVTVASGETSARECLMAPFLPMLRRCAHSRLPIRARDLNEPNDLVRITLLSALKNLDRFDSRHEGALLAYLRTKLMNAIWGKILRVGRAGVVESLPDDVESLGADIGVPRLGSGQWRGYEKALAKRHDHKREAVLLRPEFGMSDAELAPALDRPSEAATGMLVSRALVDLARWPE